MRYNCKEPLDNNYAAERDEEQPRLSGQFVFLLYFFPTKIMCFKHANLF